MFALDRPHAFLAFLGTLAAAALVATCTGSEDEPASLPEPAPPPPPAPPSVPVKKLDRRIVILGFDGVDPDQVESWRGELPNLSAMVGDGPVPRLGTTTPPQSPVAWSTFATSLNPGGHGIFDFVARNPATYLPEVGTNSYQGPKFDAAGKVTTPGSAKSPRLGTPFWKVAADAGVRTKVLYVPYSYPADALPNGSILPGLGVPDLRLTNSTCFLFDTAITPEQDRANGAGMDLVRLEGTGPWKGTIEGPDGLTGKREKLPIEFVLAPDGLLDIQAGQTALRAKPGEFTEWATLQYPITSAYTANALVRFRPLEVSPTALKVYMYPLLIDPDEPYLPFTEPAEWGASLKKEYGTYKTIGWEHDTSALNSDLVPDEVFVFDRAQIWKERWGMALGELKKGDADLFIAVFTDPDRASHMFTRLTDGKHPRYDEKLAKRFAGLVEETYLDMDKAVSEARAVLGPNDLLIVLSDHGFHTFRRGFHTNTWLLENGYLGLKPGVARGDKNSLLPGASGGEVDWSKTRAYAMGTGQVYLNLKGREGQGIVEPADARALAGEIAAKLMTVKDGKNAVLSKVYIGADTYHGEAAARRGPDLQLAFADGYQSSRRTSLGGIPEGTFEDNDKKWSGDHSASDAADTEGFVVTSAGRPPDGAHIADVGPTVLDLAGVAVPATYEGKAWTFADGVAGGGAQ